MSVWSDFYAGRVGSGYADYCKVRYLPFLQELMDNDKDTTFREEGCGIGTMSRILLENNYYNIEMFDLDPKQLEMAKTNTHDALTAYVGNILSYHMPVDVIFSHGVIEHFEDCQIRTVLARQIATARKSVVHYVPTDGYDEPTFGDERLMSVEWWLENFQPSRYVMFNDNKDLMLVWDK